MVVECVGKDILLTMKSSCSSPLVSQAYKIHPLFRATNITALKCIQSAFLSLLNCKPRWIGSHIKRNNRLLTVFFRAQPQLQGMLKKRCVWCWWTGLLRKEPQYLGRRRKSLDFTFTLCFNSHFMFKEPEEPE